MVRSWGEGRPTMRDPLDFVSDAQFKIVYDYCLAVGMEREALLIRVAFEVGRRVCEIVGQPPYASTNPAGEAREHTEIKGLRPMDIDAANGKIVFTVAKKGQKDRPSLPFDASPALCEALLAYAAKYRIKPEDRIFPISTGRVRQIIPKVFAEAGILTLGEKQPHIHALRHGCTIDMVRKAEHPEDLLVVQKQLAHSTLAMTAWYLQYRTDEAAKNLMARRFGTKEDKGIFDTRLNSVAPPTNNNAGLCFPPAIPQPVLSPPEKPEGPKPKVISRTEGSQ